MEKKILNFIKKYNLILNEPIICAVSGGVDSVCLLYILHKLNYNVVLAHVNHHKRKESEIEEKAMRDLAQSMGIPFEVLSYHYSNTDNFHNEAHHARYDFFKSLCDKYHTNTIATAHHLDDQLETVLIKLMEGSNLYGYGGISIVNFDGRYRLIRPLLCVTKEELKQYAKENQYIYYEDSSNKEDDYLRNRIRHNIIPLIQQECDDIYHKVFQYSIQMKEAFQFIRFQSIDYLKQTNNMIDIERFQKLDIAVKKDILSYLLEQNNIRRSNNLIQDMLDLLDSKNGSKSINLERGYFFVRRYNYATIEKEEKGTPESKKININDTIIFNGKYKFYFSKKIPGINAKYIKLWYNNLELPFIIRSKIDGDTIELEIGKKKVSRIFIDYKVPQKERDIVPIITNQNNQILWIYDYAKSKDVYSQKDTGDIYFVCEEV